MTPKVTVVIPVYNPGEYIQPCIDSLLAQTMPADDLEILFVDDGSTDDTLALLRQVEAEHPQVRVISIPNSGWPGKPRNVGTDEARGEYVMFVDQDDRMEPDALETMYGVGSTHHADTILGKVISDFRGVNHEVYRENRPSCTVLDAPLMESLTPHKMFRTAFLREQGIRYPEGPRRLEDQLFMAQAYFRGEVSTIVADRVCYRYLRRPDGGNAGSKRFDPAVYYGNLREVLDVVDAHTAPGEERDQFYRRFLRVELLGRLGGKKVFNHPADHLDGLVAEVRSLLDERFPESVAARMGAAMRVRTGVVRRGDRDDILALASQYNAVTAAPVLTEVTGEAGRLVIGVEVRFTHHRRPLVLERIDDRVLLPRSVVGSLATDEERRVDDQLGTVRGDLVVKHRDSLDEWFLTPGLEPSFETSGSGMELVLRGRAVLDPATSAGGRPLKPGKQDLYVRTQCFDWARTKRLGADRVDGLAAPGIVVSSDGRVSLCFDTDPHANLSIEVAASPSRVAKGLARARVLEASDRGLTLSSPFTVADGDGDDDGPPAVRLTARNPEGAVQEAELRTDGVTWLATWPTPLGRGHHVLRLESAAHGASELDDEVHVGGVGRVSVRPRSGETGTQVAAASQPSLLRRAVRRLRR